MRRTLLVGVLSLVGFVLGASATWADVIITGPFGRQIIVPSPSDVRVGPGVYVGPRPASMPAKPLPPAKLPDDAEPLPPPKVLPGSVPAAPSAITPSDFVKTFKPVPGTHEVTFLHPNSKKPVTVAFVLPEGQPRVLYIGNALVFDYGKQEVEIRFKIGGKVVVSSH
jgi:hypothetical protein